MPTLTRLIFATALLAVAMPRPAAAECKLGRCADHATVDLIRAEIAAVCDCQGSESRKAYKKCVKGVVKAAVKADRLPKACKRPVRRCEAQTTCGMPSGVACCEAKDNGRLKAKIKKTADKCRGNVCIGHTAAADACNPDGSCAPLLRPFKNVQAIMTQSCSLPSCHSAGARKGGLVLSNEDLSYSNLVDQDPEDPEALALGLKLVDPTQPGNSFLIRKLRGQGPGDAMPQGAPALDEAFIDMIEQWIGRGALPTSEECGELEGDGDTISTSGGVTRVSAAHGTSGSTVCDDRPLGGGSFEWEPEPPLPAPDPSRGIQLYTPPRDIAPGSEWETCYAFRIDPAALREQIGLQPGQLFGIKDQLYRMHQGSHHLLLYSYFGSEPDKYPEGYFDCVAGNCTDNNCPSDSGQIIPIGGTQVAGTEYAVNYPPGVGIPVLGNVLIVNLHYTNPFQPAQDIYGESWVNLNFHPPGEMKVILDGIFAINARDLLVEPWETRTISRMWQPTDFLTRQPTDAAIFQLFGHMHLRGTRFTIDYVRDGACSENGNICGHDDDCPDGQTCTLGPNAEDTRIYDTSSWDNAPVVDYPPPYVSVLREEALRWSCTHANGIRDEDGNEILRPKRCHEGCNVCGWDDADRKCHFEDGRIFDEGEPMPLVFGLLADDDMCNMFGYFVKQGSLGLIGD